MREDLNTVTAIQAEVDRLRAGEEEGGPRGVERTPGQILKKLHDLGLEERMDFLGRILESAREGSRCATEDHRRELAYRTGQLEAVSKAERDAHRSLRLVALYVETLRKDPERPIGQGEVAEKLALFLSDTPPAPDNRCRRVLCGYEWSESGRVFQCAEPVNEDGVHLGEHFAYVHQGSGADEELRMSYLEQENAEMRRRLGLESRTWEH